jgi:hypothetical protein
MPMAYTKKIVCFVFLYSSIVAMDDTKQITSTYVQRRKQYAQHKKNMLKINRSARNNRPWFRNRPPYKHRITSLLGEFAYDAVKINLGIFSWDSFKIFVTTTPFFVGARMIDEKLHNCFFDHKKKKNRNEPAQWCKEIARFSIGVPIALLSTQAVLSRNEDMRTTAQVFITGMPFVLLIKDLIKKLDFDL